MAIYDPPSNFGRCVRGSERGYLFYESQGEGLGDYFLSQLKADVEGLRVTAGMHPVVFEDFHRALSRVFPYAIFYTTDGKERAIVWAVVDCRRDPDWIKKHLQSKG